MKRIFITISILPFLFVTCSPEKENKVGSRIAGLMGARSCHITHSKTISTDMESNVNSITLTLSDFNNLKLEYSKEKIASVSALEFIHDINKKELADYRQINIVIENNSEKYEKSYKVSDVVLAAELMTPILQLFDLFHKKEYYSVGKLFDHKTIADSTLEKLEHYVESRDSANGKASTYVITGFKFDNMKKTGEPVMIAWAEGNSGKTTLLYDIYVSVNSRKIVSGSLNRIDKH
jgi:hypothetical protein